MAVGAGLRRTGIWLPISPGGPGGVVESAGGSGDRESSGCSLKLDETGADGLVPIRDLEVAEYFHHGTGTARALMGYGRPDRDPPGDAG